MDTIVYRPGAPASAEVAGRSTGFRCWIYGRADPGVRDPEGGSVVVVGGTTMEIGTAEDSAEREDAYSVLISQASQVSFVVN